MTVVSFNIDILQRGVAAKRPLKRFNEIFDERHPIAKC